MDIRPIHNDEDHRAALRAIDACWGAAKMRQARRASGVERFDPVDVLHCAITTEFGHTQMELVELLGSRSRASEVSHAGAR